MVYAVCGSVRGLSRSLHARQPILHALCRFLRAGACVLSRDFTGRAVPLRGVCAARERMACGTFIFFMAKGMARTKRNGCRMVCAAARTRVTAAAAGRGCACQSVRHAPARALNATETVMFITAAGTVRRIPGKQGERAGRGGGKAA